METVQIATSVEKTQSRKFQKIAQELGITPSDALRMFIAEFNRQKGFWYLPNLTIKENKAEPFETEEEALRFATSISMRQLKNEK
jgi:antitoxin component of RelBE/YafQ-DinJ toxin-antitoxin module